MMARPRLIAAGIALGVVVVFIAANAHLVYVALTSQPDCVLTEGAAGFRAAKPSC